MAVAQEPSKEDEAKRRLRELEAPARRGFALRNQGGGNGLGYVVHMERVRVGEVGCVGTMAAAEARGGSPRPETHDRGGGA